MSEASIASFVRFIPVCEPGNERERQEGRERYELLGAALGLPTLPLLSIGGKKHQRSENQDNQAPPQIDVNTKGSRIVSRWAG